MKSTNVLLGLLLLLSVACTKTEKETPSGMKFTVVKAGNGVLPKKDQIVSFHYLMIDSKDSVWTDTFTEGFPGSLMIADSGAIANENGLVQMLRMVSKGDSITITMSIQDFFKNMMKRPSVPAELDSTLIFNYRVKILDIMSKDRFMEYQKEFAAAREAEQLKKDTATIDQYLSEKKIEALKTESGIRYVITQAGVGENGTAGQTAMVNYSGYLLDGQYFDSSVKSVAEEKGLYNPARSYQPYEVTIDQTSVIKGWHEALKLMNKGAKATVYIPSTLAYGPQQRSAVIKPNSILVFDLEVVDLK